MNRHPIVPSFSIYRVFLQDLEERRTLASPGLPGHQGQWTLARRFAAGVQFDGLVYERAGPNAKVCHEASLTGSVRVIHEDGGHGAVLHGTLCIFIEESN